MIYEIDNYVGGFGDRQANGAGATRPGQENTIFVKGFDKYLGEDEVRSQLEATFKQYGSIKGVRLPTDRESGELKGIGFIEFGDSDAKVNFFSRFLRGVPLLKLHTTLLLYKGKFYIMKTF